MAVMPREFLQYHVFYGRPSNTQAEQVQAFRDWLGDFVDADLARSRQGLPSYFGALFGFPTQTQQQRADNAELEADPQRYADALATLHAGVVADIRRMNSYYNEAGDNTPQFLATLLQLPMIVAEATDPSRDGQVGPSSSQGPLWAVRFGDAQHYRAGFVNQAAQIDWTRVHPLTPATQASALQEFRDQENVFQHTWDDTVRQLDTVLAGLSPGQQLQVTTELVDLEAAWGSVLTAVRSQPINFRWSEYLSLRNKVLGDLTELLAHATSLTGSGTTTGGA
jgi:hypothetical protein